MIKNLRYLRYFLSYMKDGKYPFLEKLFIFAGFLYIIVPVDLVPDPLIPIGWIDDSIVLTTLVYFLGRTLKSYYENTLAKRMKDYSPKRENDIVEVDYQEVEDD